MMVSKITGGCLTRHLLSMNTLFSTEGSIRVTLVETSGAVYSFRQHVLCQLILCFIHTFTPPKEGKKWTKCSPHIKDTNCNSCWRQAPPAMGRFCRRLPQGTSGSSIATTVSRINAACTV
ncbi:hypothetical protein E2C01_007431 [Portunus trituberculatus]|uniref:Uncharacterized protein n=1 Tax=Portunus trituberculatus TaxID=210409 RepID=A0A5B7D0H3_PORTR|nr:hypothetical protein [Portunus trituberculatus]